MVLLNVNCKQILRAHPHTCMATHVKMHINARLYGLALHISRAKCACTIAGQNEQSLGFPHVFHGLGDNREDNWEQNNLVYIKYKLIFNFWTVWERPGKPVVFSLRSHLPIGAQTNVSWRSLSMGRKMEGNPEVNSC